MEGWWRSTKLSKIYTQTKRRENVKKFDRCIHCVCVWFMKKSFFFISKLRFQLLVVVVDSISILSTTKKKHYDHKKTLCQKETKKIGCKQTKKHTQNKQNIQNIEWEEIFKAKYKSLFHYFNSSHTHIAYGWKEMTCIFHSFPFLISNHHTHILPNKKKIRCLLPPTIIHPYQKSYFVFSTKKKTTTSNNNHSSIRRMISFDDCIQFHFFIFILIVVYWFLIFQNFESLVMVVVVIYYCFFSG